MKIKTQLLSTMPLSQPLIDKALEQGVVVDAMSFIKVTAITGEEIEERIVDLCYLPVTAIFTSANAVKAVSDIILAADPPWGIYCIGNATKEAVQKCFDTAVIMGVASDAATLAGMIVASGEDEVVFFCGGQRMDTLPDALRQNGITVYEVVVYQTVEVPQVITKEYDGILFFSPSAVNSFFNVNKTGADTVLFTIGNTTANAIKKHTSNKTIFSETATKESVLQYAIQYFNKEIKLQDS